MSSLYCYVLLLICILVSITEGLEEEKGLSVCTLNKNSPCEINFHILEKKSLSDCIECKCVKEGRVNCYYTHLNQTTEHLCSNCAYSPKRQCSYCYQPKTNEIVAKEKMWSYKDNLQCIKCKCNSKAEVECDYKVMSRSGLNTEVDCSSYEECEHMIRNFESGDDEYTCEYCYIGSSVYQPLTIWTVAITQDIKVYCSCNNNGNIECHSMAIIENIKISKSCNPCNSLKLNEVFAPKGCHLGGIRLESGQFKYISLNSTPYCFQCACYLDGLKCDIANAYSENVLIVQICENEECEDLLHDQHIQKVCSDVKNVLCPTHPYSWTQDGCHYSCYNSKLSFQQIENRWCEALIDMEPCTYCPDKEEFLSKYANIIQACTDKKRYTWSDQICDGRNDCLDASDEKNCEFYQCNYNVSGHNITWSPLKVNVTSEKNCTLLNSTWRGILTRNCLLDGEEGTYWSKVNFCDCHIPFPEYNMGENMTNWHFGMKKYVSDVLLPNLKISPSNIRHIDEALKMTSIMKDLLINRTFFNIEQDKSLKYILNEFQSIAITKTLCEEDAFMKMVNLMTIVKEVADHHYILLRNIEISKPYEGSFKPFVHYQSKGSSSEILQQASVRNRISEYSKANNVSLEDAQKVIIMEINSENSGRSSLEMMNLVLIGISCCSLLLGLFMLHMMRVKNTLKVMIHKNLMGIYFISFLLEIIPDLFIPRLSQKSQTACTVLIIAAYYAKISTVSWMMVEGINLVLVVVLVFKRKRKGWKEILSIGYGLPLVITGVATGCFFNSFYTSKNCITLNGSLWILKAPITAILFVNFVSFLVIMVYICRNSKNVAAKKQHNRRSQRTRSSTKAFVMLLPLLGLPSVLELFIEYSVTLTYIYVGVNGLSGLYLLLGHVVMDPKVKESLSNYSRRFSSKNSSTVISNSSSSPTVSYALDVRTTKVA